MVEDNYSKKYSEYRDSLRNNSSVRRAFPASQLFKHFDFEEDIIEEILGDWQECDYKEEIIRSSLIIWNSSYKDVFPDFSHRLWEQIIQPQFCDGRVSEKVNPIFDILKSNRDEDINGICYHLVLGFIKDRPYDHLNLLKGLKELAKNQIIKGGNDTFAWESVDYYHLRLLTDADDVDYQVVCEEISNAKRLYKLENESSERIAREREREVREKAILLTVQKKKDEEERRKENLAYIHPSNNDMPKWFKKYISNFDVKSGKQNKIRETYIYTREEWLEYLCDSSFPSTFMAGYKIVKDLLENRVVASSLRNRDCLALADIGCGNGGATIGAITAIDECLPNIKSITIEAYDYSEVALNVFSDCIDQYARHSTLVIHKVFKVMQLVPTKQAIVNDSQYTFDSLSTTLLKDKSFDFILCFKMLNELIFNHRFELLTTYSNFLTNLSPKLSETGFLILLDVFMSAEKDKDDKHIDNNHYGEALDKQGRQFIREMHREYKAIIPVPCALDNGICDSYRCQQQRKFKVEGGRSFPATYKVIARTDFANNILKSLLKHSPGEYVIFEDKSGKRRHCMKNGTNSFLKRDDCECSDDNTYYDGHELNSTKV